MIPPKRESDDIFWARNLAKSKDPTAQALRLAIRVLSKSADWQDVVLADELRKVVRPQT